MTLPGIQVSSVSAPRLDTTIVKPDQTAVARRSLLDENSTTGPSLSDFRPVALTTPQDLAPQRQASGQKRPDANAEQGQRAADSLQAPQTRFDNQADAAESTDDAQQQSGWRGFLGALTTGRISLLSGALGFLAQVFGQRSDSDTAVVGETALDEADGAASLDAADISQALSSVSAGTDEDQSARTPTELETKAGIGAYSFVNRLVGASVDTQFGNGMEITFTFPFGRQSTTVDQVA